MRFIFLALLLSGCASKAVETVGPIVATPIQATEQCKAQPAFGTCPMLSIGNGGVGDSVVDSRGIQ